MAKMTLLQMVQQAAAEVGQTAPTFLVSNTDTTAIQMLALANREGREVSKMAGPWGGWPVLRGEYTFSTVISTASYSFPVDFQWLIVQTGWDRTYKWQLIGPVSAQEWQVLKSGIAVTGPSFRFRIMAGQIYLDPTPTVVDALVFEYYKNTWCQSNAATPVAQSLWAADTDTYLLEDDLMILGLKWRFLRAKGLDYGEEKSQWESDIQRELARAGTAKSLPLNAQQRYGVQLINDFQIPDTGFGT